MAHFLIKSRYLLLRYYNAYAMNKALQIAKVNKGEASKDNVSYQYQVMEASYTVQVSSEISPL